MRKAGRHARGARLGFGSGCLGEWNAAIVLRASRESIIGGRHNLRAGEAGAVEASLRFLSVLAGLERTGDHLLPVVRDASAHRQPERLDFARHRRRARVGSK